MIKVTNLKETDNIKPIMLKAYIAKKITALMEEYSVDTLDDIGCFVILNKDEFSEFPMKEMEFVEILLIGKGYYLHGVEIIGDGFGKDIFYPVGVVKV